VLAFPDRDALLDFIDQESAGLKGGNPVGGADVDHDGKITDGEGARAMDNHGVTNVKAVSCLGEDSSAFLFGENGVGFVIESSDGLSFMVISHEAFEGGHCATGGVKNLRAEAG